MLNSNSSHGHLVSVSTYPASLQPSVNNVNSNQTLPLNFNSMHPNTTPVITNLNGGGGGGAPLGSSLPPPPTRTLHGPRSPAPSAAVAAAMNLHSHSRSPSPAPRSRPTSMVNSGSRNGSIDLSSEGVGIGIGAGMEGNVIPVPLGSAGSRRMEMVYPPSQKSPLSSDSSEEISITGGGAVTVLPPHISEKAAGKRKMVDENALMNGSANVNDGGTYGYGYGGAGGGGGQYQDGWRSGMLPDTPDANTNGFGNDVGGGGRGGDDLFYEPKYMVDEVDETLGPDRWKRKTTYVYDAAAERTKDRIREGLLLCSAKG